jgi:hypothetical protein
VYWLSCLLLGQRFAGSNLAEDDGFLREIRNMTSFRGEVKPSAPCRNIYGILKNTAEYDRDTSPAKLTDIYRQRLPCFATRCVLESEIPGE